MLKSTVCVPCNCESEGSLSSMCDRNGQCKCKGTFYGTKCSNRDCVMEQWSRWSTTCRCGYTGTKTRARTVRTQPKGTGNQCLPLTETGTCQMVPCNCAALNKADYKGPRCEDRDCKFSQWSSWTTCRDCPSGTCTQPGCSTLYPSKDRTRTVEAEKKGNGTDCSGPKRETQGCTYVCKTNCWTEHGILSRRKCKYYKE